MFISNFNGLEYILHVVDYSVVGEITNASFLYNSPTRNYKYCYKIKDKNEFNKIRQYIINEKINNKTRYKDVDLNSFKIQELEI